MSKEQIKNPNEQIKKYCLEQIIRIGKFYMAAHFPQASLFIKQSQGGSKDLPQ